MEDLQIPESTNDRFMWLFYPKKEVATNQDTMIGDGEISIKTREVMYVSFNITEHQHITPVNFPNGAYNSPPILADSDMKAFHSTNSSKYAPNHEGRIQCVHLVK